ncbi:MAG: hypothetical protein R3D25_11440 [Geminicoccaceae bacterium]
MLGAIPRDAVLGLPQPDASGPSGTAPPAALEGTAGARFTASLDLLQTGDRGAAEIAFGRWLEDFPDDPQAPVAAYWIESQLAREDFATAAATFAGNYRRFGAERAACADSLLSSARRWPRWATRRAPARPSSRWSDAIPTRRRHCCRPGSESRAAGCG